MQQFPELPHNNNTNHTNIQNNIYSAVYTATCQSSLWVIWMKVSQLQVAANS